MIPLLVVDDDRRLRQLLKSFLDESGFETHVAANAAEARSVLATHPVQVMILDVMMEGEDGVTLTESLRDGGHKDLAILLLTARDTVDDCIKGLNAGADDYLTKPFEPRELLARIRALTRRKDKEEEQKSLKSLSLGEYAFDLKRSILVKDGEPVFLTSSELALLRVFAQSPGKPFTREELAQRIGHRVSERSVDVQIVRLRRKLGDDSKQPRYLQTVRHIGYGLYPDSEGQAA
ncbi:MAG: response regulator transcription factor [Alphaproteobacteria bacterium]|nr:response regulator transcription factor [Alphaproteobacteria bacterium]